ncbi:MAG: DUF3667 domain-containing protein [Chlorobi bacterium]|nr:DUF3667 domain-containing protein [Chlorobiota bacterium]
MEDLNSIEIKCPNCENKFPKEFAFCPYCGQKNRQLRLDLKFLVNDFLAGSFNIDSKFFVSFRYLITNPALLTREFLKGRRMSFLSPLRMYLLVSLVYFSVLSLKNPFLGDDKVKDDEELAVNKKPEDFVNDSSLLILDSLKTEHNENLGIGINNDDTISSVAGIELAKLKTLSKKGGRKRFMEQFNKFISISMFFIMPIAAFFLYLFFGKRRKNYYFENLIFLLHLQSLAFLIMAVFGFLYWLFPYKWIDNTSNLLIFVTVIAWIKEFYSFKWGKAILASLLFYFSYFLVLGLTFSVLGYISLRLM